MDAAVDRFQLPSFSAPFGSPTNLCFLMAGCATYILQPIYAETTAHHVYN